MSAAASDLDKRGGDIESYLENFCRCSILHSKIGYLTVPKTTETKLWLMKVFPQRVFLK